MSVESSLLLYQQSDLHTSINKHNELLHITREPVYLDPIVLITEETGWSKGIYNKCPHIFVQIRTACVQYLLAVHILYSLAGATGNHIWYDLSCT